MTTVDARGDQCPIPVVKPQKAISALTGGVTNLYAIVESMAQAGKVIRS